MPGGVQEVREPWWLERRYRSRAFGGLVGGHGLAGMRRDDDSDQV